jgi:hypothetical protein
MTTPFVHKSARHELPTELTETELGQVVGGDQLNPQPLPPHELPGRPLMANAQVA